jgi:hypothetical protein
VPESGRQHRQEEREEREREREERGEGEGVNTREEWGRVSVVGCSPTTWLQPRAPQELKVELSVQDASVPPTG